MCWKQSIKKHTLVSLVLDLGSPELLDGGRQTIGSSVEVDETEDGQQRHDQIEDLEGLADVLIVTKSTRHYGSSVIAPDMAHTNASMQRIQNTHNIVDGDLHVNVASHPPTQRAEGARTKEMGKRTAAVSWE